VPKIFIIAGEPSGDLHGSYVVKSLLNLNQNFSLRGWGGSLMQESGCEVLRTLDKLAFMGFVDVMKNISLINENFKLCKTSIKAFDPDLILFIDYPGFNLRMAKWAKNNGYKTAMYIAPQTWAWKEQRVKIIKSYIDRLIVILPFEEAYFNAHDIEAKYFGHPLVEEIKHHNICNSFKAVNKIDPNKPIISLFPGSRIQEIEHILPIMLSSTENFDKYEIAIAAVKHVPPKVYQDILVKHTSKNIHLIAGENYNLLSLSYLALISSGTATLEAALLGVPQIVCYKTSSLNYTIAKALVKLKFISLVNLILDKNLVPELIQEELLESNLKAEILNLSQKVNRRKMQDGYNTLKLKLKEEKTSELVAEELLNLISN